MNKESDTHRASLMLVLWLDLREAMRLADAAQGRQTRLLEAWSLAAPPGEDIAWVQPALIECRRRREKQH